MMYEDDHGLMTEDIKAGKEESEELRLTLS